jgi:hypothetical protein
MLSKYEMKTLKDMFFERIDLLEASLMERFTQVDNRFEKLEGGVGLVKTGLASVQETVLNINAYMEGELKVHLHQLEKKDRLLDRRISKVQKKIEL